MKVESKKTPEYEKPTAVPLGEASKGSGQCNEGSAVIGAFYCEIGAGGESPFCISGTNTIYHYCEHGTNGWIQISGCQMGEGPPIGG